MRACFILLAASTLSAHPGIGVVVDSRGNVFYTDLEHVWKIAGGRKSIAVRNVHTHELYLDAEDNLYGEHLWYEGDKTKKWGHYLWKLSRDGKLTRLTPPTEGFRTGYSFVRDRSGNMYWTSRGSCMTPAAGGPLRVCKTSPEGTVAELAGGAAKHADGRGSQAGFTNIRWSAASPDGIVYVIDADKLRRIRPDGSVDTMASALNERTPGAFSAGDQHLLMGLWPDLQGNVYVANYGARKVKRIGKDGSVTVFYRSPFPYAPAGVTVAGDRVYVLEYTVPLPAKVRVRRLNPPARHTPPGL